MKKYLLGCVWLLAMLVLAVDARPLNTEEAEITQVLKNQFDGPATPLKVPIVVVSGDYAVVDWVQIIAVAEHCCGMMQINGIH